ncbi:MAG: CrcB family protein [Akkermansia sp.]|nr:CrcB family protein [Akkermansia sp.]
MQTALFIGLGSFVGGILRHLTGLLVKGWVETTAFPWHTLAVNLAGCLLLGLLTGLFERGFALHADLRAALTVGVCGGFTTFSTFAGENFSLFRQGAYGLGITYILASLVMGVLLLFAGYALSTRI